MKLNTPNNLWKICSSHPWRVTKLYKKINTTLSDHRTLSAGKGERRRKGVREDEREWERSGVMSGGGGGERRIGWSWERCEWRWERREIHVTADRKKGEGDITSFLMKIITFWPFVYPERLDLFIFFSSNYSWRCRLSGYVTCDSKFFIF